MWSTIWAVVDHAPYPAARAHPAASSGERHYKIPPTSRAPDTGEAVGQDAVFQILAEGGVDDRRNRLTRDVRILLHELGDNKKAKWEISIEMLSFDSNAAARLVHGLDR